MKRNLKSEKGAITLVVLIGMLFLTAFLMSMYIQIANRAQNSAETTKQIEEQYNNLNEANDIYDSYFADTDVIPIYNREQLEKIGSGEQMTIDGKIYTFASDSYYTLKNDLDLGGYYDEATGTWTAEEGNEWEPLPLKDSEGNQYEFTGVLDGLGHTISGIYINNTEESNQGLFGTLEGTVKNLKIIDGYINGLSNIGAIAGTNNGTITNCDDNAIILALSTDNGKVQVDEIWYNSLQDYINGIPMEEEVKLITFYINNIQYTAEEGMTWQEWIDSPDYDSEGFYVKQEGTYAGYVVYDDVSILSNVENSFLGSHFIVNGGIYHTDLLEGEIPF